MYPIKFKNLYYEKVWGGRDLQSFRNNLPEGNIGESWDVACHPHGTSIISNGKYKGEKLDKLIIEKSDELIGTKINPKWFPLLIKILNTSDKLSVQVHPDDSYAMKVEGEMGKTEVWYVAEAKEGASLIVGLKEGVTREELERAIKEGTAEELMMKKSIKKGETYFIKSGLIHTICEGAIIVEIQQNSDTTYRLYDYNRGRELHIDKALDVIDFSLKGEVSRGIKVQYEGYEKTYICLCKDFSLELYDINMEITECSDLERFYIFTCVEGNGEIKYGANTEKINKGESVLIPASMGEYIIKGKLKILKSYVPDIEKVKEKIMRTILK